MSKYANKSATINSPKAITHGQPCVVVEYVRKLKKYRVDFDGGWTGWYPLKELTINE